MRRRRIRTALIINNLIPLLFTILVFTISYYIYTSRILMEREKESLMVLAEQLTGKLSLELNKMNNLALNVSYSSDLKDRILEFRLMETEEDGKGVSESDEYRLARYRLITGMVRSIAQITGPYKAVPQINLILSDDSLLGSGIYDLLHPLTHRTRSILSQYNWKSGVLHFTGLHRDELAEEILGRESAPFFISLFKVVTDIHHDPLAVLEVKQYSDTLFSGFLRENEKILIFTADGVQIFPSTTPLGSVYSSLISRDNINTIVDFRHKAGGTREMIAVTECIESGWIVMTVTSGELYLRPVVRFLLLIILISLLVFGGGFFISLLLSRRITEPLGDLNNKISQLDWNLLELHRQDTPLFSTLGEVAELHMSFQEMNQKLDSSLDSLVAEKTLQAQSRVLALQAQMDPHFIYNLITNIGIMAEEGETDEIVQTIGSLSRILRYVADGSSFFVLLKEELEVVNDYIDCMRIRYGEALQFRMEVPAELLALRIPRHSVLPLVENTVKYGLDTEPPWDVVLTGREQAGHWRITFEDSGAGFCDEALERLKAQMEECRNNSSKQLEFHINGMGLINLYSRFCIFYKEDFIFQVANREDRGGVRIVIGGSHEPKGEF